MLEVESEELRTGLVVPGGYRLDRVVGEGGMGVVWSATQSGSDLRVALKFLRPDRSEDQKNTKRMIREAQAASSVAHPNVAHVIEVRELDSGLPFIVMELLEGETLAERLRRKGKLDAHETARIVGAAASAIEAAQAAGVVHRDLKPDNVFLVRSGEDEIVKVLDFGIAKTLAPGEAEGSATSLTTTGAMIGTAYYMAPEQIFGDEDVDGRADVWALGVMLYECLAGKRPTQAPGVGQIIKLITTDSIVPLRTLAPEVPSTIADVTMRALSRDRAARPSVRTVRDVLERFLRGERAPETNRRWLIAAGIAGVIGAGAIYAARTRPTDAPMMPTPTIANEPDVFVPIREEPDTSSAIPDSAVTTTTTMTTTDAQSTIALPPKRTPDAGARDAAKDARSDAFDIPISDVRK